MRVLQAAAGLALFVVVSCGVGGTEHGTSTDPNAATGFMTANDTAPATAEISRDDGILRDSDGRPFSYEYLGKKLPAFEGETLGGGQFASDDIHQWSVLYVWGIWCGDCIADAPYVADVAARIARDDGLGFMSVHTPPSADRAGEAYGKFGSIDAYFNARGYSFPTIQDTDASLRDKLAIGWTPSYLLISPDGIVRGYRTDLSVAGDTPVNDFFADIARVREKHADIQPRIRKARIGPSGAGGIRGKTAFNLQAIESAFPGKRITPDTGLAEGESFPKFNVFDEAASEEPLFSIWPSWDNSHVGFVVSRSEAVEGPNGALVGKLRFGDLAEAHKQNCYAGVEEYAQSMICALGSNRQFQYIFSPGRGDNTALKDAAPDAQARAILAEFRYLPRTPETD